MEYNVDYFIDKFENISVNLWITGQLTSGQRHCALGHCGVMSPEIPTDLWIKTKESSALIKLFGGSSDTDWEAVCEINDKGSNEQAKNNILEKLKQIKKQDKKD